MWILLFFLGGGGGGRGRISLNDSLLVNKNAFSRYDWYNSIGWIDVPCPGTCIIKHQDLRGPTEQGNAAFSLYYSPMIIIPSFVESCVENESRIL